MRTRAIELKYISKICGLNFEIVSNNHVSDFFHSDSVYSELYSDLVELNFLGFYLNVKSKRTKNIEVFSQRTDYSKI